MRLKLAKFIIFFAVGLVVFFPVAGFFAFLLTVVASRIAPSVCDRLYLGLECMGPIFAVLYLGGAIALGFVGMKLWKRKEK